MKDNLEAKFYNQVLESIQVDNPSIENVYFKVDNEIDNPSNVNVIDCSTFYKEDTKSKKSKANVNNKNNAEKTISTEKCVNDRYSLANYIV
ncbi:MAG: hypothetical protein P1U46_02035 [Patescibacteria group bacterium]|nr:hypothetical protein [Patescibacteria group bacterium]